MTENLQKSETDMQSSALKEEEFFAQPMYTGKHAVIEGDVRFGADASVWHNATIRSECEPVRIGKGTNIQDGCVIHTDEGYPVEIGENVTVGHGAIVHGAHIEDGALIGMGAILLNGCVIGKGAIIGAGALVGEGKVIPPFSLAVGIPAKVIRTIDDDHQKVRWTEALESAEHYTALARQKREEHSGK